MNAYRQSPFANITPVVKNLLIINFICFLPFILFDHGDPNGNITRQFAMHYVGSPDFRLWQIITYMFMHGGWEHIFFNMLALFMFGPIVEYSIGPKRFLILYFICGIGAVVFQLIVQAIQIHAITGGFFIANPGLDASYFQFGGVEVAQKLSEIYNGPLVGASGAIFGLLVVFGMLYPNMELFILFIPIPVKAKYIIPIYIVIELFLGFGQFGGDDVAHFAHVGGALLGYIMVKIWRLQRPNNFFG